MKNRIGFLAAFFSFCNWGMALTAEASHHVEAHAAHAEEGASMHLPNFVNILYHYFPHERFSQMLHNWENVIFSLIAAVILAVAFSIAGKRAEIIPGGLQNFCEMAVESLDNFVTGILGERWRKFTPFVGTVFLYVFTMNFIGVIPFLKSPTSSFGITFPLGLAVFFYVQATGIRELGFFKYLDHLAGEPRTAVGFVLIPLMLFLHVVGEFVKPLSLSLRLFGNIWGEDVLIAVFVGMGKGVPIHFPFLFLATLTSFVQATVFSLLTTIYISLMLPHEHEHAESHVHEPAGHEAAH